MLETAAPPAGAVRCTPAQAAKTYAYLERFVPFEAGPKASVSATFARCCLAANPDLELDPAPAAAEAASMAAAALAHPDRARMDLDPLLLVSCHGVLADAGFEVGALREMLGEVATAFAGLPAPVRELGRVRHIASLLAARGFGVVVGAAGREAAELAKSPARILNAPGDVVADLADHLFADGAELGEDLTVMLALTALGELRNYRVDLGAKLLRLVTSLGRPCLETEEGLNFVALQRRRTGAYGFVNPFLPPSEDPAELDRGFFLPMTLNAAWLFHTAAAPRRGPTEAAGAGR
ncbi:MAG TPA: hypothetical protein VFE05_23675 [Longimicrobiaceae bacterium]|jgi:hypothetical protein|nr:hypothetical protein [Longimicrobiaceae bacterium]